MALKSKCLGKNISKHSSMPPSSLDIIHFIGISTFYRAQSSLVPITVHHEQQVLQNTELLCISKICPKPSSKSALLSISPLSQPEQLFSILMPCKYLLLAFLFPCQVSSHPALTLFFELFSLPVPTI